MRLVAALALALTFIPSFGLSAQGLPPLSVDPALPTAGNSVALFLAGVSCPPLPGVEPEVEVRPGAIEVRLTFPPECFAPQAWTERVELGRLPAGPYLAEAFSDIEGDPFPAPQPYTVLAFAVEPAGNTELALFEGRFRVFIDWSTPSGRGGRATAVRLSDGSGYFWFFAPRSIEALVKIVDGRALNSHFWVFISSLTDVEMTVRVLDVGDGTCLNLPVVPPDCPTRTYVQGAGENRNFLDTEAFYDEG